MARYKCRYRICNAGYNACGLGISLKKCGVGCLNRDIVAIDDHDFMKIIEDPRYKYRFLIGTHKGAEMGDPTDYVTGPYNIIRSNSEEDALQVYNKVNECSYYYGHIMASLDCMNNPSNISDYCSKNQVLRAIKEARVIHNIK